MPRKTKVMIGQKFGTLTVVAELPRVNKNRRFLTRCDCGRMHPIFASHFYKPDVSCGIHKMEYHRSSHSNEYKIYKGIVARCETHPNYFGRGIKCEFNTFADFLKEIGPRPSAAYSVDRIDNNGDYKSGNVRWATAKEQANNTRQNRRLELNGETLTIQEWSDKTHISASLIRGRINRLGWPVERALTTKPRAARTVRGW